MKTLSRKRRILTSIICFSLLAFVNIGCETENEIEEIIQAKKQLEKIEAKTMAKGNIKRTRIKQRRQVPTSYFRASIIVNNDNKDEVSIIALEIEKKEGILNETKTYYLEYYTTVKKDKYYTFADIKFDGKDLDNQEVTVNITLLDANKKPISTFTETTAIAGLSKANIKRTRLKKRRNGLYKMTAEIENDDENDVAEVAISVSDLQGNATTFNATPKKKNTINTDFSFEKESTSEKMSIAYVLKDFYVDEINTTKEEVSLESNLKVGKVLFNENSNGLYTALVTLKKDNENDIEKISLTLEKEEGIADKTITYDLKYLKTEKGVKYFTTEKVTLIDSKVKEIPVIVTIYAKSYTEIEVMRVRRYRGDRG